MIPPRNYVIPAKSGIHRGREMSEGQRGHSCNHTQLGESFDPLTPMLDGSTVFESHYLDSSFLVDLA